jgi:hypothetical protein
MFWEFLRNLQLILGPFAAIATISIAVGRLRRPQRSSWTQLQIFAPPTPHFPAIHANLDLWEKILAIGKGVLVGGLYGCIAFFCTGLVCGLPVLFFFPSLYSVLGGPSTIFMLICLAGTVVGLLIGTISGLHIARNEAGRLLSTHSRVRRLPIW